MPSFTNLWMSWNWRSGSQVLLAVGGPALPVEGHLVADRQVPGADDPVEVGHVEVLQHLHQLLVEEDPVLLE